MGEIEYDMSSGNSTHKVIWFSWGKHVNMTWIQIPMITWIKFMTYMDNFIKED